MAYGADGEPSDGVRFLAQGVDLLIHEATGPFAGHSTAVGAARLAREAEAKRLVLVHLAPQREEWARELAAAREVFGAGLVVGEDRMRLAM
jgi:ribonuclease Z